MDTGVKAVDDVGTLGRITQRVPRRPLRRGVTAAPRVGERLGQYQLCLELARGGMATVYLARTEGRAGLHRYVALKCIRPDLAEHEKFVDMFFDEAQIASQIHHANVCSVIDFDRHCGVYYIAMEYLRGETLSAARIHMARKADEWAPQHLAGIVARLIADAAEGLHAAHELRTVDGQPLNIVHRDVSPENVFVTYDGNVKIVDFGVACASDQRHKTRTGVLKGKYSYIQPEVLHGSKPDRRADIWGLGVVMWELLAQKRLFDADTEVEVLQAVDSLDIAPPSKVREGVPPALDDIVLHALERDPAQRFQTARELGRALTRFLAEQRLAIGLAEVAEWMDKLFPSGRACKLQLLEVADQLDSVPATAISPHVSVRASTADIPIHEGSMLGVPTGTPVAAATTATAANWRRAVYLGGGAVALALVLYWSSNRRATAYADSPGPVAEIEQTAPSQYEMDEAPSPSLDTAFARVVDDPRPAPTPTREPDGDPSYTLELSTLPASEPGTALLRVRIVPPAP